ncbi:GT2 family glycosyltransferase [Clostridium saccharoperbutylacetonicum]|uniref:Group 2 glycosyl transferase n=1 Tax=Clostridium saccharoperbutylacetonicum N1-4(HMT) TaxID=931276 RepID=M1LYC8_9CLOT|nr:bifunctional glycosyltransferase/class I SAM-dependent methyltransferase [Clostridium saccharoperbutylacetonicum]AGF58245.1 group 2 glycosyl transferase [Clostridium saccharoperbutylacetonicum N1-4(HMT)]NRT60978.1 GT2 family glycosyltransferase [Clostridium saccharoperbutylacetonicum]NSB24291.1 GT2 family glycosyltransferase [Clostridium saccharoperbutylacetonicum]NSB43669.1 GT2 family glycosyltransferase [Clostridium saccharoperbutylacetonicum]
MRFEQLKSTILAHINDFSYDSAIQLIREGLSINLFDSDLYYYMGLVYNYKKNYNCAYLCFENALQYSKNIEEKDNIIFEINKLKESKAISINNFSIIILTFNNLKYTIQCIESIRKYNTLNNYEIIVIDNNSIDDTREWLKAQKDIKYILNSENNGFPAGCNQGISIANKDNDVFLLNNDTLIMPNSIFTLRMGLYSNESVGSVSSVSNEAPYQTIQDKFESISQYYNYSLKNNIPNDNKYEYRLTLIGFALLFKRTVLNEVGLLDEIFTPGNYEDNDISLRIVKLGYKNILCKDSFIYHYGGKSFKRDIQRYSDILNVNNKKFQDKWRIDPEKSFRRRNDILELIDEPNNSTFNILEIGCACGATLLEIKNLYPNANIYGVELDKDTAEIAKTFANIAIGDIENSNLNYKENFFDYIILADVLNYLKYPVKTLENIKKYLKYKGKVLISVPNVMNFTILKDLINGNWYYENEGFLDAECLKFFTYKDILAMLKKANYNNIFITSIANMPETIEDNEFINKISALSNYENIQEELINFEYYIKAQNIDITNDEKERAENLKNDINIIIKELDKNLENDGMVSELIKLIKSENITSSYIIKRIENKVKHQGKILNKIAIACLNNNLEEHVLPLLEKANVLEPRELDIIYNLSAFLTTRHEYIQALDYLNSLYASNNDTDELEDFINEQINQ